MLTIDTHFVRSPLRRADKLGVDVEALLAELDIPAAIFEHQHTVVHADQYLRLIQRIWAISGDEYFGLTAQRCKTGHFSMMVRYVQQFDSLRAVVKECCRFYQCTREDLLLDMDITPRGVGLYMDLSDDILDTDHFLLEFMLVSIHRFFCWITGKRIPLLESQFAYLEPDHVRVYRALFPGKRTFGCERNAFFFDPAHLSLPLVRNSSDIRTFLANAPADLIVMPGSDDSFTARIKSILLETLRKHEGVPDFNQLADRLTISPRTLRRKLRAESISYQQIKDMIRRDIAIDKLVRESLSVAEIGHQLGFTEPTSFPRAFKQWTGVTPAEYRLSRE